MSGTGNGLHLIELFDELAGSGRTDYIPEILEQTARTPQRPTWRFPQRWLPSALADPLASVAQATPGRALMLVVLAALILAGLLITSLVASRPRLPAPFGPAANGRIAYALDGEIWVAASADASPSILVGGPESDNIPIFSPRGDRLAFLRHPDRTGTVGTFFLMVARDDGSQLRQLSGPITDLGGFAWSPAESGIAFSQPIEGAWAIAVYSADGEPATVLDLGMPAKAPAFRPPDGRQIAFLGLVDGEWEIHVANSDGSNPHSLGLAGGPPTWSPDGASLAFDHAEARAGSIGRRVRVHVADITPAGELLADRPLEFDARNREETGAVWSPDGRTLAFVRARNNRYVVAVGGTDGRGYAEIGPETGPPAANLNSVWMWAPDGRSVFQTFDDGPTWMLDPRGDDPQRAAFGDGSFTSWQRMAP